MNDRDNDSPKTETHIKILSYLVAVIAAIVTGTLGSSVSTPFGFVLGVIIFMVISLADVRSSLELLLAEVPEGIGVLKQFIARPQYASIRQPFLDVLPYWYATLFKPVKLEYMLAQITRDITDARGLLRWIWYQTSILLFNAFLLTIINFLFYPTFSTFPLSLTLYVILPLILLAGVVSMVQTASAYMGAIWFLLISMWGFTVVGSGIITQDNLGMQLLLNTFIIGIAFGCALGLNLNLRNTPVKKVLWIIIPILIAGCSSSISQSAATHTTFKEMDPILSPLIQTYWRIGYSEPAPVEIVVPPFGITVLEPQNLTDTESSLQSSPTYSTPFPVLLSFFTIAFLGSIIGLWLGLPGHILLLLEAPIFYIAWYNLRQNNYQTGIRYLKLITAFDDWRIKPFWRERECYQELSVTHPQILFSILASQSLYSARHQFALTEIGILLSTVRTDENIRILLSFLPFNQFENDFTVFMENIEQLEKMKRSLLLEEVFRRRLSFFEELQKSLPPQASNELKNLLNGCKNLATCDWIDIQESINCTDSIIDGFAQHQHIPLIRLLVSLTIATRTAIEIDDCQRISLQSNHWKDFNDSLTDESEFDYLLYFGRMFRDFAIALEELTPANHAGLSQAALNSLYLRVNMEKINEERLFGIKQVRLVACHWDNLLVSFVRQHPPNFQE